jgi:hypothetical protein
MTDTVLELRTPDPPRAVDRLVGTPGIREASLFGRTVRILATDPGAARAGISERLADGGEGMAAVAVDEVDPSLEDVFVSLVLAGGGAPAPE